MNTQRDTIRTKARRLSAWTLITAVALGAGAVALARLGNPPNMGICSACFERDLAGGLGFFSGPGALQYLRPEVPGLLLGAFIAALLFGEFRSRGGSSPLQRFVIGGFIMVGALVFMGCPLRMLERIAAGDYATAGVGLLGLLTGVGVGCLFIRRGFTLGSGRDLSPSSRFIMPLLAAGIVALILYLHYDFAVDIEGRLETKFAAPVMTALLIAVGLGFLSQRSGYCSVGGYRDAILWRDYRLLWAYGVFTAALVGGNLLVDQFWPGSKPLFNWGAHPLAHSVHPWNFLGMVLVGLGSVLIGGCPYRQLVAAGQGNSDAAVTIMGLLFGAGVCHNFGFAAAPDGVPVPAGPPLAGQIAVVAGIALMFLIGLSSTSRKEAARHEAGSKNESA